jgi:hypothetical protein
MKRKLFGIIVLMAFLTSCAWMLTAKGKTETIVISYETMATVAFPTVLAYLQQREKNGSLSGDALVGAKKKYNWARELTIQAGDKLKAGIDGQAANFALVPSLLRHAAMILADLSGGKVSGNELTIPVLGGGK